MNLETTVYENNQSRQKLNRQFMHQSGASTMDKVINGFSKGSGVFIFLSILISTFSVYQDFYPALTLAMGLVLGAVISFFIGFALAVAIEFFRHLSIKGIFATSFDGASRTLIGVIAFLLITTTIITHYRSLDVFGKILVNDALETKNQEIAYQRGLTNDNVKALVEANVEATKGINNGNKGDDDNVEAITLSNNKLIETMIVLNGQSNKYQTDLTIKQSNEMADTVKGTLFVLFIIIEMLAVFGIVSKFLLNRNTDHNVKELATLMDKTQQMQDNVYQALGDKILNDANANIAQVVGEYATHKQPKPPQIGSQNKTEEVAPVKLIAPTFSQRRAAEEELDCEDIPCDIEVSVEKEFEKAIDFSAFSEQEGVLIKILWNNGSIKPNEYLIERDVVITEASENFGIKRAGSILTNLYDNLMNDHNMIMRPDSHLGYKAKVALKKEIWTEKEKAS